MKFLCPVPISCAALLFSLFFLTGCSTSAVSAGTSTVSISISPTAASLVAGGTQQFSATVTGTSNTAVTWTVNGAGAISSSGLYTAPATVSAQSTVTIVATAQADVSKAASATVTITPNSGITVSLSSSTSTIATNEVLVYTATVSGATNTAVTWKVNGIEGGNSSVGYISTTIPGSSGEAIYLAPANIPSSGTVTITAVSLADSTATASKTVTIQLPSRSGRTYYVSTSGNDANTGTSLSTPWRTIQHAADTVKAGDTVQVAGGTYNEALTIKTSGDANSGYVTFTNAPGETPILDGSGLTVPAGSQGLINMRGTFSYIVIRGFQIQNYTTNSTASAPVGIYFEGSGSYIQLLNNHIQSIVTTASGCGANALGVAFYGTNGSTAADHISFLGNEVNGNTLGCSENVSFTGNVQYFVEANNSVHDSNNIGIANIGFEGVSPNIATDQARDGWVFQNTIHNISSYGNPAYGNQYAADGYYCDGCTRVIVERNSVSASDLNYELASEHLNHVSSYVILRNNLSYKANSVGISIGGYSSSVGGTSNCTVVNNTLWADGAKDAANNSQGGNEFQIQYNAANNIFENNIVYANAPGEFINVITSYSSPPVTSDYNLFYSTAGNTAGTWIWSNNSYSGLNAYRSASGQDAHSQFVDPVFVNPASTPPNLDVTPSSPAINFGTDLGSPILGAQDFSGNPRITTDGHVNAGAYQQ